MPTFIQSSKIEPSADWCYLVSFIMTVSKAWRNGTRWVFDYPERVDVSIHNSLTNRRLLLAVRVISLLILSFRYVIQIAKYYDSAFNIAEYLTELGFLVTWSYFALTCQDFLINHLAQHAYCKQLSQWIALQFEIAICIQAVVTILFWSVLYDYSQPIEAVSFLQEVGVHGFPFICLLADLGLNTIQFPKRHLILTILVGILYLVVNVSWSLCATPVYKPLDWVSLMCYVYLVACIILVVGVHTGIRRYWEKYRRPKLVELLKEGSENYFSFEKNSTMID